MAYIHILYVWHIRQLCVHMYTLYMCICTDRQINNRAIRLPARQAGYPLPLVRRHCWLSVPTVSHVMNNCNLYFILLVYYSLSMARFTWLGLAARGVLKVSGEGEAHVRFAAISWRFSVCVCSHTCQATLSSQSTLSSYLPASLSLPCRVTQSIRLLWPMNCAGPNGFWLQRVCECVCLCVCAASGLPAHVSHSSFLHCKTKGEVGWEELCGLPSPKSSQLHFA